MPLPGGDFQGRTADAIFADLARDYPDIGPEILRGIFRRHGTLARTLLGDARTPADLGLDLGGGLFAREIAYLKANEWARTTDDILWRRTKCGLVLTEAERRSFAEKFR